MYQLDIDNKYYSAQVCARSLSLELCRSTRPSPHLIIPEFRWSRSVVVVVSPHMLVAAHPSRRLTFMFSLPIGSGTDTLGLRTLCRVDVKL